MIYIIFKKGQSVEWDDIAIFTTYSSVEHFFKQHQPTDAYVVVYEGTDRLVPLWQYQYVRGRLQRFSL